MPTLCQEFSVECVDIDNPDLDGATLSRVVGSVSASGPFIQAYARGAAIFGANEGCWVANGIVYFTDKQVTTSPARAGRVWALDLATGTLTGAGIERLLVSLSIGSFDAAGSVTRPFSGRGTSVGLAGNTASLSFDSAEYLDVFIGNPLGDVGLSDWRIDTRGLVAGDVLAMRIAVPEPGAAALVLSALLALGAVRARRGRR